MCSYSVLYRVHHTELSDGRESGAMRVRCERLHGLRGHWVHIESGADAHAEANSGAQSSTEHSVLRLPLPRLDSFLLQRQRPTHLRVTAHEL